MSTAWRWCGLVLIAAASVLAVSSGPWTIAAAFATGMLVHLSLRTDMRWMLGASVPVVMFGAVLIGLQWLGRNVDLRVPLRVIAIFALSTATDSSRIPLEGAGPVPVFRPALLRDPHRRGQTHVPGARALCIFQFQPEWYPISGVGDRGRLSPLFRSCRAFLCGTDGGWI